MIHPRDPPHMIVRTVWFEEVAQGRSEQMAAAATTAI